MGKTKDHTEGLIKNMHKERGRKMFAVILIWIDAAKVHTINQAEKITCIIVVTAGMKGLGIKHTLNLNVQRKSHKKTNLKGMTVAIVIGQEVEAGGPEDLRANKSLMSMNMKTMIQKTSNWFQQL